MIPNFCPNCGGTKRWLLISASSGEWHCNSCFITFSFTDAETIPKLRATIETYEKRMRELLEYIEWLEERKRE